MGDAMGEEDGSTANGGMSGDAAAQAAHNARMVARAHALISTTGADHEAVYQQALHMHHI